MSVHADRDASEDPLGPVRRLAGHFGLTEEQTERGIEALQERNARLFPAALGSFVDQSKQVASRDRQVDELKAENARLQVELINEMVACWHSTDDPKVVHGELSEYLGMTEAQYSAWAESPSRWIARHGSAWFNERFPLETGVAS
jgi:hypothetical protein